MDPPCRLPASAVDRDARPFVVSTAGGGSPGTSAGCAARALPPRRCRRRPPVPPGPASGSGGASGTVAERGTGRPGASSTVMVAAAIAGGSAQVETGLAWFRPPGLPVRFGGRQRRCRPSPADHGGEGTRPTGGAVMSITSEQPPGQLPGDRRRRSRRGRRGLDQGPAAGAGASRESASAGAARGPEVSRTGRRWLAGAADVRMLSGSCRTIPWPGRNRRAFVAGAPRPDVGVAQGCPFPMPLPEIQAPLLQFFSASSRSAQRRRRAAPPSPR